MTNSGSTISYQVFKCKRLIITNPYKEHMVCLKASGTRYIPNGVVGAGVGVVTTGGAK